MLTEDLADSPPVALGSGAASPLSSASFTPPDGSLVLVLAAAGWSGATQAIISVTDSGSHAWTNPIKATGTTSNGGTAAIFFCYFVKSPGSITLNVAYSGFASGSGGRYADILVFMGTAASQVGAATASKLTTTGLDGTFSITTTKTGSQIFGVSDDSTNGALWTPSAAVAQDNQWNNTGTGGDNTTSVGWFASSYTGIPGAVTIGGTWAANGATNHSTQQCAFEILPAADLPPRSLIVATQAVRSAYL